MVAVVVAVVVLAVVVVVVVEVDAVVVDCFDRSDRRSLSEGAAMPHNSHVLQVYPHTTLLKKRNDSVAIGNLSK